MRAFSIEHRVHFDETNLIGNVYFAHYVRWQGLCREEFLVHHAPETLDLVRSGALALVTVSTSVDYLDECFAGDLVTISMTPTAETRGHRIAVAFTFTRDGSLVARGRHTVACLRRTGTGLLAAPLPDDLSTALASYGAPTARPAREALRTPTRTGSDSAVPAPAGVAR